MLLVANLTQQDGIDFLRLMPEIGIKTNTTSPLQQANKPWQICGAGRLEEAAVLVP